MGKKRTKTSSERQSEFVADGSKWTWPVRRIRKIWHHWGIGRSAFQFLGGLSTFSKKILRFEGNDFRSKNPEGETIVRSWPSARTMSNPVWWFVWAGQFALRWLVSRPYLPMLLALPAIAVILGSVGAVTAGSQIPKGTEAVRYKQLVATAMENEDFDAAMLGADALVDLFPKNAENLYRRALILDAKGDEDAAQESMKELANDFGSANAALWLADQIGSIDSFGEWKQDQIDLYLEYLSLASENAPENLAPVRMRGRVLQAVGDIRGAYEILAPLAGTDTETTHMVAFLERQLGLTEKADARSEGLIRNYKKRLQQDMQDVQARIQAASLLAQSNRIDEALSLLLEGLSSTSNEEKNRLLKTAIVECMVLQSRKLQSNDKSPLTIMKSLQVLKDAMSIDPNSPILMNAIAEACLAASESKNNELTILREALVQGVQEKGISTDTSHFILGTIALNEGQIDKATHHLDIALKTNPNLPGVLNNLACAITEQENPDWERALRLSESALRSMPNHAYLRETRGQILLRLKRYPDAISDLEFALAAKELAPKIRPSLAEAYDAIGEQELAERHRQLAEAGK